MPPLAAFCLVVAYSFLASMSNGSVIFNSPVFLRAQNLGMQAGSPLQVLKRVQQLIAQGRLDEARSELMRARKTFPHRADVENFLGVVEAEENNPEAAEEDFQRAIQEASHYSGAYLNLAHLYESEIGQNRDAALKAIDTYQRLLRFEPKNVEANYQLALLQAQRQSFNDSLRRLAAVPLKERDSPRVLALLCADHAALGHVMKARSLSHQLLQTAGLTEADVLPALPILLDSHHSKFALLLLQGLEARGLASPGTMGQLAGLYEQTGQLKQARQTWEKVAAKQPDAAAPLIKLAHLANRQHDFTGALGYLAHARALEPQDAGIHFFFGMVCIELDLHQEAYVSLKKAVQLSPDNPYYNYALGAVCTGRQDGHEAIPYFKKYCSLKPRDPRGKLALGAAYYYSHDLKSAQTILEGVMGEAATAAGANYYLGRIAKDEGQWAVASRDLQRAIRYAPQFADAYAALGSVYLSQKNYSESEKVLLRSIQLEPDNYRGNLNLLVLYERTKDKRAAAQEKRFAEVRKEQGQRAKMFLRTIRVVP